MVGPERVKSSKLFLPLALSSMDSSTATTATTLHVHRCRFVDYTPSAVTALAFPPLPLPSGTKGKERETNASQATNLSAVGTLAVGHANGNIDLCEWTASGSEKQASQAWVIRKVGHLQVGS